MHDSVRKQFESYLYEKSKEITASWDIPINIDAICDQFNVRIIRKDSSPTQSYLIALDDHFEIHIPYKDTEYYSFETDKCYLKNNTYTPFERYIIAHELGHLFLISKYSVKPCGESEYWILEDICNFFARNLLIPETFIEKHLKLVRNTPQQYLKLAIFISKRTQTPWPAAAKRIVDYNKDNKNYAFFRVQLLTDKNDKNFFRINSSSIENRKEILKKIDPSEDLLGQLLYNQLTNEKTGVQLSKEFLESTDIIERYPSFNNSISGFVFRYSKDWIYMVIQYAA